MNNHSKKWITLPFGILSLISLPTQAAEQYYNFGFVGVDTQYEQSVYAEKGETSLSLVPDLFYYGEYGFIDGNLINVSVLPYLGISGQWRFSEADDELPKGINERDGNGELGITLGTVGARFTYLQDVTNTHNGYELQLHLGYKFNTFIEDFTLTPYAEVDYRDQRLSQHLYNISTAEAANSGLDAFEADSSFVYKTGLIGIYSLTPDWLGLAKFGLVHHDSESPLIQRDIGWSMSLGITYQFTN